VVTEFLARGELGPLRMIQCRNLQPARPRPENLPPAWRLNPRLNGGGILVNWGGYDLDYLLGITGWTLKPARVLARTWTIPSVLTGNVPPESDAETHYSASIICQDGILLQIERGEYMISRSEASWQIIGEKGSLDLNMVVDETKKITHHFIVSPETGITTKILWEGMEDKTEVHRNPVLDFARAIRNGSPPKTGLEQSLVIQKITDAIYGSAKTGQPVEILDQEPQS
jgi:predicted dehydrogenase